MYFGVLSSFILGQVCINSICICVTVDSNYSQLFSAVFVMGMLIPWNDPRNLTAHSSVTVSPFTIVFEEAGLQSVAHIMNAVILITVSDLFLSEYASNKLQ